MKNFVFYIIDIFSYLLWFVLFIQNKFHETTITNETMIHMNQREGDFQMNQTKKTIYRL